MLITKLQFNGLLRKEFGTNDQQKNLCKLYPKQLNLSAQLKL